MLPLLLTHIFEAMNVTVQSKKRQKCFMIDPKDGVVQPVQSFTDEDEQSFAISKLELWRRAGLLDGSEVMDVNHKKVMQFDDAFLGRLDKKEKDVKVDSGERLKNAVESAQKAAAELSMLVQLSSLLHSNNILSLHHKYTDSEDLRSNHQGKETNSLPQELPIAQRISIQRSSFRKASISILSGLEHVKSLMKQRQHFANTLQQCQQDKDFKLCYVDRKSNKRVLNRKYEPRKDYIAADCSVHVQIDQTLASGNDTKGLKWVPRSAETISTSQSTSNTFVPILMGRKGMELSAAETDAPIYTLQYSLLVKNGASTAQGLSVSQLGRVSLWNLLQKTLAGDEKIASGDDMEVETLKSGVDQVDAVQALAAHCARRKHETLCRTVFARLQDECIRETTQWDVLSGFNPTDIVDTFDAHRSGSDREDAVTALYDLLSHKNTLTKRVVVVDVQDKRVVLRVSEQLLLTVTLVPIVDGNSSTTDKGCSEGVEWIDSTLSAMALQSLLCVLQPSNDTHSSLVNKKTTTNEVGDVFERKPLFGSRRAKAVISTSMTAKLLELLEQRVDRKKHNKM